MKLIAKASIALLTAATLGVPAATAHAAVRPAGQAQAQAAAPKAGNQATPKAATQAAPKATNLAAPKANVQKSVAPKATAPKAAAPKVVTPKATPQPAAPRVTTPAPQRASLTVNPVSNNSRYVSGKATIGAAVTVRAANGSVLGTAIAGVLGNYTVTLNQRVHSGEALDVTASYVGFTTAATTVTVR